MSKNEKSAVAQEITNKICEVFGINPSEVSVNHRCMTTDDGHEMEVVDCSVNLTDNIKTIEQKITIPSKDEVKEKVVETWDEVYNKVKEAFKDERVVNAQNQLKSAFGRLLEAVYQNTDKNNEEDELEELVDDSECGEEKCCQCGTPCVISDDDDDVYEPCNCGCHADECENIGIGKIPCASEIKSRLQKKFDDVIRQKKDEKKEREFFQELKDNLLTMVVKKIVSEDYQSLTNDLNAEGAGVYVILSEQETTNLEILLRKSHSYDKPMNFDYLESEVINGIAGEICEHLDFNDAIGYLDDKGQTIFKFWF